MRIESLAAFGSSHFFRYFLILNLLKLNPDADSCWSSLLLQLLRAEVTGEDACDDGEQVSPPNLPRR